jgi:hypothetical protein
MCRLGSGEAWFVAGMRRLYYVSQSVHENAMVRPQGRAAGRTGLGDVFAAVVASIFPMSGMPNVSSGFLISFHAAW